MPVTVTNRVFFSSHFAGCAKIKCDIGIQKYAQHVKPEHLEDIHEVS